LVRLNSYKFCQSVQLELVHLTVWRRDRSPAAMPGKNGIVARGQEPLPNRCPDICVGALRNRKPSSGFSILPWSHELRETARGHRGTGSELSGLQRSLFLVWAKYRQLAVEMPRLCSTTASVDRPRYRCWYGGTHTDLDN